MTMLELVARAIARAILKSEEDNWKDYSLVAKAAIEAMLEPTEEMYEAAQCGKHEDDQEICKEVYQAMINAALKE